MDRAKTIEKTLKDNLKILHLEVINESHKHAGHSEAAKAGNSHFQILIVSSDFAGKSFVQRHRMINDLLKIEFDKGLHALAIKALTPEEFQKQN